MAHPEAAHRQQGGTGAKMIDRGSVQLSKKAPILALVAVAFGLGGCASSAMNCRLFGFQCGEPTAEQEAKAADDQARLQQENAVYGAKGHYGTPYGPGPQYGEGGGDQYGYGPAYSYARQAPNQPNTDQQRE